MFESGRNEILGRANLRVSRSFSLQPAKIGASANSVHEIVNVDVKVSPCKGAVRAEARLPAINFPNSRDPCFRRHRFVR